LLCRDILYEIDVGIFSILFNYYFNIVGDAQDPINYVTNFRLNKYSLSCLLFSEIVN